MENPFFFAAILVLGRVGKRSDKRSTIDEIVRDYTKKWTEVRTSTPANDLTWFIG